MQNSASTHCTYSVLAFLKENFRGRVLSRTANPWPAHNPDINPPEFYFWAAGQNQVEVGLKYGEPMEKGEEEHEHLSEISGNFFGRILKINLLKEQMIR